MSQKRSNSKCGTRPKTSDCNDVGNGKAEQVCPPGTAFDELQKELERELQNSEQVLLATNNYEGSPSRDCGNRRKHGSRVKVRCSNIHGAEESHSRLRQMESPRMANVKNTSMPNHDRRKHSSNGPQHESHNSGTKRFLHFESSHHHHHHHHHHDHHHESSGELPKWDEKSIKAITHLSKFKKSPCHSPCELPHSVENAENCPPKAKAGKKAGSKVVKLPEMPCLLDEQIEEMIKCEAEDVESAWYLTSEVKKTYKKPCPKQQKAEMGVKALVQASKKLTQPCGKKYSPLEHPEPEDISPETAAAMMFLQEQGVKMEDCPKYTISRLFPDDPRPALPEKEGVSVVDPSQNDQNDLIEKSFSVPSEGVSDSAYTRRTREQSDDLSPQRSYDVEFAIGQSKREYVLVAQKPQRVNVVRFRGGNTPSWFPWYLSAFPDEEGLNLATSPSGLFYKAWLCSNPGNIPSNDVIVLD